MTITFTELHQGTHAYNAGTVQINTPFSGNTLAVELTTKPEYANTKQIIGHLFQFYGNAQKSYALYSGKDVVRLELPETDKLWFSPTSYLSDNYTLTIGYTDVGTIIANSTGVSIPEQILGLPSRVTDLEGNDTSYQTYFGNIQTALDGINFIDTDQTSRIVTLESSLVTPLWSAISGKPLVFPPDTHSHEIADVLGLVTSLSSKADTAHNHTIGSITGLQTNLDSLASSVATNTSNIANKANQSDLTALAGRVTTLESATPSSSVNVSQSAVATLSQSQSTSITAKTILGVWKKEVNAGTNIIPAMTSNTAPSSFVASTNGSANGSAFNLFDKVLTDRGYLAAAQTGNYVQLDFGTAVTADTVSFLVRNASIAALEYATKIRLFASNDGTNFGSALLTLTNWSPVADTFLNYGFAQTTARYWRVFLEERTGGYPAVNEMALSISGGFKYTNVSANYTISTASGTANNGVFNITKNSSGSENVVITYLN